MCKCGVCANFKEKAPPEEMMAPQKPLLAAPCPAQHMVMLALPQQQVAALITAIEREGYLERDSPLDTLYQQLLRIHKEQV